MVEFNDRRKCSSCGQTNPNDNVMGSMGCGDCGGTLPYKARPSRKYPGHIEVEMPGDEEGKSHFDIPHWATDHKDAAVRAQYTSFIRPHPDNPKLFQAGTYSPSRQPRVLETGEGKTKQQAVDQAMLNVAGKIGQKWWKR